MFRVLTCSEQSSISQEMSTSPSQNSLDCSCIRPPLPNTIQSFGEEIESFLTDTITQVTLDNCSAPHYNMRIQLGDDDVFINTYIFRNFISGKFILEGEIKDNISIKIENFMGSFGNILGHVELRGVLRCYNDSEVESNKARLKISFHKVDTILISNLYVKDPDNACVVEIDSSGSEDFLVKGSSFNEVESLIDSENCVWNEAKVDCKDLFKPQPKRVTQ